MRSGVWLSTSHQRRHSRHTSWMSGNFPILLSATTINATINIATTNAFPGSNPWRDWSNVQNLGQPPAQSITYVGVGGRPPRDPDFDCGILPTIHGRNGVLFV